MGRDMGIIHHAVEFIFGSALIINALLFIPQIVRLLKTRSSQGISLLTFFGFLLIQLAVVLHGVLHRDALLIWGYSLSMLFCGVVVILIVYYRKNDSTEAIDFKTVFEQLPGHIYWKDKKGTMLYCNRKNWEAFGLKSLSEYLGKTDYEVFPKDVADMLWHTDEEIMRTGGTKIVEEVDPNAEGGPRVYLSHKAPLLNRKQEIIGVSGVSLEITEAKRINRERLELLENIIAVMPGHVYWVDREGVYLGCNDNQARSAGLSSRKAIIGKRNQDLPWNFHATTLPETLDKINREVIESGKAITLEEQAISKEGEKKTYLSSKVPITNHQGEAIGMVGISLDITDLKTTQKELLEAKKAAENANIAKTTFLYNMQHDLRTPFSGILGLAEFVERSESDPRKKEQLHYISQSARTLLNHLNQIFEVVSLESGEVPILEKPFRLTKLIEDIKMMIMPAAKDKALVFEVKISQNIPEAMIGDPIRVERILINLISNAVKFTEQGGINLAVELLKADKQTALVQFLVEDTGSGISEEKQDLIFQQFKAQEFGSGLYPGKGLGLRLVKRSLDDLGGEVHLTSRPGKGSIFKVVIPFKQTLVQLSETEVP